MNDPRIRVFLATIICLVLLAVIVVACAPPDQVRRSQTNTTQVQRYVDSENDVVCYILYDHMTCFKGD
jgi:hypothetical protein